MNGIDRVVEIERLAALDPMDYEVVRTTEAERLGFRTEFLDRAVKKKRRALGLEKADDASFHDSNAHSAIASAASSGSTAYLFMVADSDDATRSPSMG